MKHILRKIAAFAVLFIILISSISGTTAYAETGSGNLFTEEEKAFIEQCPALKVGYVSDRKPVSFCGEDGELAGISRKIFDRISAISGLTFNYVELPEGSVTYDYLMGEGFDLVTSVEYNQENQAAHGILISNPYLSSRKVIVAKSELNFTENTHYTVAISTGSQTLKKVFARQYPNFELVDYPSIESCLDAVNRGDADLLIQNQYVADYWLNKPIYNNLKTIPVMELSDQLCFSAVTPLEKAENDPVWKEKEIIISIINKSISQISDSEVAGYIIDATMENMYEYTFTDMLYQYRYTFILLGIALAFIGILIYVNMHIRMQAIADRADAKAKGSFLSTMSHEIRTPLNGLLSLNYLMAQNLDNQEKLSNYLQQSSSMAQYLLSLVNNILDMSKLQESDMELKQSPVDLQLLFETVALIEKNGMEDKKINFQMDIELPWAGILGDEVRIQQILINLIDNARKYTNSGGIISVTARQTKQDEDNIETTVIITDTGRGMSEEFQKKIFDPFTQERSTVSHGNEGTGLGMSICATLAKRMGGSLDVESKLGEGSKFTFRFVSSPISLDEHGSKEAPEPQNPSLEPSKKLRILIAEDNELNGQILTEILQDAGFDAVHVLNGKEALKTFAISAPGEYDVILMDILMPEMDGFEATKAIRALQRKDAATVKIFACTANSFKEDYDKAMECGMNAFVAKPIKIEDLLQKLKEA